MGKSDDIVNEYNNTQHITFKMKQLKIIHILTQQNCILTKKLMIKILNLKLVIMQEFQNTKTFLLKYTHQIGLKKLL